MVMSDEGVCLDEEFISNIIDNAQAAFRRHYSGAGGQMLMPSDHLEWWVVRAAWAAFKESNPRDAEIKRLRDELFQAYRALDKVYLEAGRGINRAATALRGEVSCE